MKIQTQPGSFAQPTANPNATKNTGSFSRPPLIKEVLEQGAAQEAAEKAAEKTGTNVQEDTPRVAAEKDLEKQEKKVIEDIKKELKITIDDDDLWNLILGNTLEKRNVEIIPNMFYATFRSISMKDTHFIDERLAEAAEKKRMLDQGYKNLEIHYLVAGGVIEAGAPGKIRALGDTLEARFEAVNGMSTIVVDKLSKKWGSFALMLELLLKRTVEQGNI